jgi:glutamine cyclotransferase
MVSSVRFPLIAVFCLVAGNALAAPVCPTPKLMTFQVESEIHRDVTGFTEGLEVHDGDFFESTGALGGGTRLMRINPQGHVTLLNDSGQKFFGEGLTFLDGKLFQLSWEDHQVFVYDQDIKLLRTMRNPREGWGLTNDGRYLIFGDGSSQIFFAQPDDFTVKGAITVRRGSSSVSNINELEYVAGKIYANIWMTRNIVRIDAKTGCIEAQADLTALWDRMTPEERQAIGSDNDYVLNGIAYDPASQLFTITGKEWPMLFTGRFSDR